MRACLSLCALLGSLISGSVLCDDSPSLFGAFSPGDIIIGILNSVHRNMSDVRSWNRPQISCTDFNLISFVQTLAAVETIESINNSGFLPGTKLGYIICDSCASATKAMHCVQHMLAVDGALPVLLDYSPFKFQVKVFLGDRYSEMSIAVAKLLSLYMIPQVSCLSSAPTLSDKLRYPSFYRVIPSDLHQTRAMVELMTHFGWDWVGVVSQDDDYGEAALEAFLREAQTAGVCVDFIQVLSTIVSTPESLEVVADHIENSSAHVVLLILRPDLVASLFEEVIRRKVSRTWIASDAWSTAGFLMTMDNINKVGDIFGFTFITGNIPGFEDYLRNLRPSPGARNDFIQEYKQLRFNCTLGQQSEHTSPSACNVTDPQEANDEYLVDTVDLTAVYSQRVAVYAIAHAIRSLLNCSNTSCSGDVDFLPWKLVDFLDEVNFTLDGRTHYFNNDHDFEDGYDLLIWKKVGDERALENVGMFTVTDGKVEIKENIPWSNNTVPKSRCSETCPPGTEKTISDISCCYNCSECNAGFYSNQYDQATCQRCSEGTYSLVGSVKCDPWRIEFLEWSSAYSVVVLIGAGIGILLLAFSLIYFLLYRNDSKTEDNQDNLVLSCIMMFGLMVSFWSLVLFLGWPSDHHCRAQQAMYGLGFTLCVSCILSKAFVSFLVIMSISPERRRFLSRFKKPFVTVALLMAAQVLVCIFWFVFGSPAVEEKEFFESITKVRQCTQGSMGGFGAMHVYIAVLSVVCFLLAFKGKVDDTEPIVFSMLFHLFVWLCAIPIFITQKNQRTTVQVSAIMVSNYGVIVCHVLPKWKKIISEKIRKPEPDHDMSETSQDSGLSPEEELSSPSAISQAQLWPEDS